MERHQIVEKPKLGFTASFKEALKILFASPKLIFFSFPLLASLLAHHILLHPTFIQLLYHDSPPNRPGHDPGPIETILSHRFLISAFLFSALVYFLDLLTTIATVSISAALYGGGSNSPLEFKQMVAQPTRVGLKGPLATSLCALLLSSLTLLGFNALSRNVFLTTNGRDILFYMKNMDMFFALLFGVPFVVLLAKYVEWSAVWNMGIVISILDKKNMGFIAIGVASYLSRGSRKVGFRIMMVFFVLKVFLWLPYVYAWWNEGSCGIIGNVVFVSLDCVGNIVMWVVLMVYFYDCKRELLVKKIDLENNGKPSSDHALPQ